VLEDPTREVLLELPGLMPELVAYAAPEADPERPLLFDDEVTVRRGVLARVSVRRAAEPIPLSPSRATRRGGLVVRSGRAAHEVTLVGLESRPGARHLYGEVVCEAIEGLQREALGAPRPQVVVRVDRSGLNEAHPLVQALTAALERVLRPIVDAEERRAGARLVRPGRALRVRDELGLRALNDALRGAFDAPGSAGFARGVNPVERAPLLDEDVPAGGTPGASELADAASPREGGPPSDEPMRFKQSPLRMHPGEQRTVSLLIDPARVPRGTPIEVACDAGLSLSLPQVVPEAGSRGWSRVSGRLRALASAEAGSRPSVFAAAGAHQAELVVLIVRHRGSGWVREIARKEEDAPVEAEFDPENGVVTVFEGRPEFRALEKAARRAGLSRARVREYVPYRMLEVEVAANAVYWWAAERVLERRQAGERIGDAAEHAFALRMEAQSLRHRVHEKLMRAFLGPEVFEGGVSVGTHRAGSAPRQLEIT
jgi:hypothetical protein